LALLLLLTFLLGDYCGDGRETLRLFSSGILICWEWLLSISDWIVVAHLVGDFRAGKEECDRIERFRIEKSQKAKTDRELP